ncbi:P-loop NTPase fold protein [Knoellia koreensis]|uniref:AAA family ATPase n=1 Tax=Knoellia koreensis TaxID=2730921 RepID=A0A849HF29_9MICO|nr:P-loop NTPase fold protein [Knoellia sp. DB2414S]NNM45224.1 AAA family ATPase [Knoellia sp. DB2414S]
MAAVGDNPIRSGNEDRLRRRPGAGSIAEEIRHADASEGFVLGVVGPWGSGKTSILNMVREFLEAEPALVTVDFNPWAFSGTDELMHAFFRELSAQLKLKDQKLGDIAQTIDTYGDLMAPVTLLPFVGGWFERLRGASKVVADLQEKRTGSFAAQRDRVAKKLLALESPIVVIIDDIDRLESGEIRDIFKLVRLTASFPNIVYVLAFDRQRVEEALTQSGFDGRAYLEKIVQLGVEVPAVPEGILLRQITTALDEALSDLPDLTRFNSGAWPDVLVEIVRPLIKNMRDVKRYAASVRSKVRTLDDQVELVDVMGLEAVRLFLPPVFDAVVAGRDGLTTAVRDWGDRRAEDPVLKQQVEAVVRAGEPQPEVVRALIHRLFPAAGRHIGDSTYGSDWQTAWLKARRVANPDVLAVYLEHVANARMHAFSLAEQAFAVLTDADQLAALFEAYDLETLEDVISSLEAFEEDYPPEAAVPASQVLWNVLPRLPERQRGMQSFGGSRLVVTRVALRLLRRLDNPQQVAEAVKAILPAVESLSSRLELITMVGYVEGAGHELVSDKDAKALEEAFRADLVDAAPADLAGEQEVGRLLYSPKMFGGEVVTVDPGQQELATAVLLDSRSEVRSQSLDSRAVHRRYQLHWDLLNELFDGEDNIKAAVEPLRDTHDEELAAVIELVDKYLNGWRPSRFGEDD